MLFHRKDLILLTIIICILSASSTKADDIQDITYVDVVKRKGLFYEIFSTTPHTGHVVGLYK